MLRQDVLVNWASRTFQARNRPTQDDLDTYFYQYNPYENIESLKYDPFVSYYLNYYWKVVRYNTNTSTILSDHNEPTMFYNYEEILNMPPGGGRYTSKFATRGCLM